MLFIAADRFVGIFKFRDLAGDGIPHVGKTVGKAADLVLTVNGYFNVKLAFLQGVGIFCELAQRGCDVSAGVADDGE